MRQALFILVWGFLTLQIYSQTVYVTPSGKKYHTENCTRRGDNSTPIELKDAVRKYQPCKVCKPPILSNAELSDPENNPTTNSNISDSKNSTSTNQCKAITKKGTQCSRNAEEGSDYCWQHNKTKSNVKSETNSYNSSGRTIHTGPRGGKYYINSNGKKTYIKKKK